LTCGQDTGEPSSSFDKLADMPYDAGATRERLLAAAVEEFAARGLAGGRVDRIAGAAAANKRAIYDYFGGKEQLFDAALTRVVADLNAANPLLEDDLPEYAGRLFDYLQAHPEAVRMNSWWRLERPRLGPSLGPEWVSHRRALRERATGPIAPVDLVVLILGLVNAWSLSAPELLGAVGESATDPARLAAHRTMLIEAAGRLSG
jgi:AcrR family transcriptional regulator